MKPLNFVVPLIALFLWGCGPSVKPPVYVYGTSNDTGAGVHAVQTGDTLSSISHRYNVSLQHIIETNRLQPPYNIYQGQRLRLPPPSIYKVREGDSVYTVSRLFAVDTFRLSQTNKLQTPYVLRVGQTLKIPYATRIQKQAFTQQLPKTDERSLVVRPGRKPPSKAIKQKLAQPKTPARTGRFVRPVSGRVVSKFGLQSGGLHNDGINIQAPLGSPVGAAENGVVVYVGDQIKGQGNLVLIRHQDKYISAYGHLDGIDVVKGDVVKAGQTIGRVGASGNVNTPQLHFEIRKGTKAVDPAKYI